MKRLGMITNFGYSPGDAGTSEGGAKKFLEQCAVVLATNADAMPDLWWSLDPVTNRIVVRDGTHELTLDREVWYAARYGASRMVERWRNCLELQGMASAEASDLIRKWIMVEFNNGAQ